MNALEEAIDQISFSVATGARENVEVIIVAVAAAMAIRLSFLNLLKYRRAQCNQR